VPDVFGNPTPLEVLAQLGTEQNKALNESAGDPGARREIMLQQIGQGFSGVVDPRLAMARKRQDAMQKAMAITRNEGESELDFNIRQHNALYENLKSFDPNSALDVRDSLVKLENERQQQNRLKAEEARQESQEQRAVSAENRAVVKAAQDTESHNAAMAKDKYDMIQRGLFYEVDPNTQKVTKETALATDPNFDAQIAAGRARGNIWLDSNQVREALLSTKAADYKFLGSDEGHQKNLITAATSATLSARRIIDVFDKAADAGINSTSYFNKLEAGFQGFLEAWNEGERALGVAPAPVPGTKEWADANAGAIKYLQDRGAHTAISSSLLTQFAYVLAKTTDPRVTEPDYQNAYKILSATRGNPALIAATLHQIIMGQYEDQMATTKQIIDDHLTMNADNKEHSVGYRQATGMQHLFDRYTEATEAFKQDSENLMKRYGMLQQSPAAKKNQVVTSTGRKVTVKFLQDDGAQ